jgi:hypothetical protein
MATSQHVGSQHLGSRHLGTDNVEILPLVTVSQAFPARPSSLPEVRDFVRRQLSSAPLSDDDVRTLCERLADVLLDAAGVRGSIQVSLRVLAGAAEVDVLFAPEVGDMSVIDQDTGPSLPLVGAGWPPVAEPAPAIGRPTNRGPIDESVPIPGQRLPRGTFAEWLAARLRRDGITMETAANRLNVSTKTVSRWVGGTTEPRLRDLYRIREVFGEPPLH